MFLKCARKLKTYRFWCKGTGEPGGEPAQPVIVSATMF